MKVLVTGGCGFIGSNLIAALKEEGHSIVCVDDMSGCRADAKDFIRDHPEVEFISNCFASDECLNRVKAGEFDTVFHTAAIPRVSYSVEEPFVTTEVNVSRTTKLMEACRDNVRRFIFSSSSSVYGGAEALPTPETHPKSPKSPYAWQKSCIEDLIEMFCSLYGLDAVSLRYFNVFGPGQFGGSAYATAISAWCDAIKNGDHLRKDGTGEQSRDLCYVDNVVSANILAMNRSTKFHGEKYNVACGDRTSNNEILDYLKERYSPLDITQAPFRAGDVMHTQADVSSSSIDLGYEPLVRFWDGLEHTLAWWKL
jgi:UDP-glucose 4-epimerase